MRGRFSRYISLAVGTVLMLSRALRTSPSLRSRKVDPLSNTGAVDSSGRRKRCGEAVFLPCAKHSDRLDLTLSGLTKKAAIELPKSAGRSRLVRAQASSFASVMSPC